MTHSPARGAMRLGMIADGVVKIVLGLAYAVAAVPLGRLLGTELALMLVAGVLLALSGAAEIRYLGGRRPRTCMVLLGAYDGGWVLATVSALLLARLGSAAAGEVWIAYQAAGAIVIAVLLISGWDSRAVRPQSEG